VHLKQLRQQHKLTTLDNTFRLILSSQSKRCCLIMPRLWLNLSLKSRNNPLLLRIVTGLVSKLALKQLLILDQELLALISACATVLPNKVLLKKLPTVFLIRLYLLFKSYPQLNSVRLN